MNELIQELCQTQYFLINLNFLHLSDQLMAQGYLTLIMLTCNITNHLAKVTPEKVVLCCKAERTAPLANKH
jgi:hypothetical protein